MRVLFAVIVAFSFFVLPDSCVVAQEDQPSPEDLIARHVEAIGGEMALDNVETVSMKMKTSPSTEYSRLPTTELQLWFKDDKMYGQSTKTCQDGKVLETYAGFDGEIRWAYTGQRIQTWDQDSATTGGMWQIYGHPRFARWLMEFDGEMEVLEKKEVGDREVWMVKFQSDNHKVSIRGFDARNGLMVYSRMVVEDESIRVPEYHYKYQDVDSIKLYEKIQMTVNEKPYVTHEFSDVVINDPIDDDKFVMPEK